MDILIQNNGNAPIYFTANKMESGKPVPLPKIIFEAEKQITKISEETYNMMLKNPFYKAKFEAGILVPLTGQKSVEKAVGESIQSNELFYSKYLGLVSKIEATKGTAEYSQLKPFLDSEGMPGFDLCKKNLGDGFEMQNLEQFRARYLVEKANGMHDSTLKLPNGGSFVPRSENVKIQEVLEDSKVDVKPEENEEKTLEEMTLEELKQVADDLGVEYNEDITFARLIKRVKKGMEAEKSVQ